MAEGSRPCRPRSIPRCHRTTHTTRGGARSAGAPCSVAVAALPLSRRLRSLSWPRRRSASAAFGRPPCGGLRLPRCVCAPRLRRGRAAARPFLPLTRHAPGLRLAAASRRGAPARRRAPAFASREALAKGEGLPPLPLRASPSPRPCSAPPCSPAGWSGLPVQIRLFEHRNPKRWDRRRPFWY